MNPLRVAWVLERVAARNVSYIIGAMSECAGRPMFACPATAQRP
jgi:hypothetical protein